MPLEQVYFVTEIVVGIAFVISIIFLALQVRQNSTFLRYSMSQDRRINENWLFETLCTDNNFRAFHSRIMTDYENFTQDEKYRADSLAMRTLTSNLNELLAYQNRLITEDEWRSLKWILEFTATRPNIQSVYERIKDQYPKEVQRYWESLPKAPSKNVKSPVDTNLS